MVQITIVGCGVSGLTCALRLQEDQHEVTIVTRDLPPDTTSAAAGAVWYGNVDDEMRQWAYTSLQRFVPMIPITNSGVLQIRLREVSPDPMSIPWFADEIPYCERIAKGDLPAGYADGFLMDVPLIEPPRYLNFLKTRFEANGGHIVQRDLTSLAEITADNPIIINCSGVGARELVNDANVFPIRGQTVLVDAPDIQQGFMDDYSFTYIFPRADGCLLGGISQPNKRNLAVDPTITENIIARCIRIEPTIQSSNIIGYTVGLRPGRYEPRLEAEALSDTCIVIHNYGHAGVGFTFSWGCAEAVATLVAKSIIT